MIKKLRIKLIIASMTSLVAVLFIIWGIISVLNYHRIVTDADRILTILTENEGKFPQEEPHQKEDMMPEEKGGNRLFSPELPYESRYFSVLLNDSGSIVSTDTGKIATIDTSTAIEYALEVWEKESEKGFIGDYRYFSHSTGTNTRIIFLDCGRDFSNFTNFVLTSLGVSVIGVTAVFALMIFLSARIVKPFSGNYEKQKRFITDAGHELKTPLTIIDADTEVLELDFGENEWLQDIQNQTRRMADLTNNLIFLSRMEEECSKDLWVEIPLSNVVEETVETFQVLAKTRGRTLNGNIQPMIAMQGDEKAICRLITILLDNAIKYSEEEGQITVTLEKQKKRILLSVFNTTEFISKTQLKYLFDRFYRTDGSRNSQTGGYGLGLSIAAATVERHRGKITAATEDEKSLLITVTFPL